MYQSKRLLILALATITVGGSLLTSFAQGDTLTTMCFRGRTIQVPLYLRPRYIANGAMDNACPTSSP